MLILVLCHTTILTIVLVNQIMSKTHVHLVRIDNLLMAIDLILSLQKIL